MAPSARWPSEDVDPSPLGKPLKFPFSGQTAPNRFLKAAMTERISSWDPKNLEARGIPSKELINLYRRWGEGGYGVVLTGNILLDLEHLEAAGNPVIPRTAPFEGERFDGFKALAKGAKAHGSLCIGQVNHPGRQVSEQFTKNPISASDVQLEGVNMGMTFSKPRAASQDEINGLIEGWAHAAEYLEKAGYDGVQLHAGW
jgi:2,4-dienoyl-CoA reductase-like NADH-dependent reductase (Old Yellow Enzyme family)